MPVVVVVSGYKTMVLQCVRLAKYEETTSRDSFNNSIEPGNESDDRTKVTL